MLIEAFDKITQQWPSHSSTTLGINTPVFADIWPWSCLDLYCFVKVARGGNMVPAMIDTKLMTRETYTLYGIEGDFGNKDGKLTFTEKV